MRTAIHRSGRALLLVGVQDALLENTWRRAEVIGTISSLVNAARLAGTPVVWVQHHSDQLSRDDEGFSFVPELIPAAGESRVAASRPDSFAESDLDDVLSSLDVGHLHVAGARSDEEVHGTVTGAVYRGYQTCLISDGHTCTGTTFEGSDVAAEQIITMINKLAWTISLPQIRGWLCPAAELDLSPQPDDTQRLREAELDNQSDEAEADADADPMQSP